MREQRPAARQRGFTLIELLVSLTLLALLASVALPFEEVVSRRNKESELRHDLIVIRNAIDAYKRAVDAGDIEKSVDQSGYPPNLRVLVDGVVNKRDPNQKMIYFLRRLPADPMCGDCAGKAPEDTWQTRGYASDADSFSPGDDVYDIRSTSKREGLNGIPYDKW
ncbi:type II secretion system protein [Burkholderia ubonensis]|uniref:type II secretion system protein n=1 Tax=Burkholderia ubonensis TaxID=101571 RepID=UPI00075D897C|nr:type II secretion system protein [Burkholderia ubonensis]KVK98982.1 general secretion pathway protein GspG [Burkholderia ubonensis]KVQ54178.1 general secretion pathway protein GspG [Burkholderia ubonensis]